MLVRGNSNIHTRHTDKKTERIQQRAHLRLEGGETFHRVALEPAVKMSMLVKVEGLCRLTLGDKT